jgi:L-alanine-DL-glutamate epimerase-like enolase superfamily enzyme
MLREVSAAHESWPLSAPFRISRGVKTVAEVVAVEIRAGGLRGRGEAVPYARYGETVESVMQQVHEITPALAAGMTREALQQAMSPGAARNAVDCALWDLQARMSGQAVHAQLGLSALPAVTSALTVGIDTIEAMHAAALKMRNAPLIKVKVDAHDPEAQLRAVRSAAPHAKLIVDPNESWNVAILSALQPLMVELNVDLIEQPLPASEDEVLEGFKPLRPICADESCHTAQDLPQLLRRYQAINIKLDKTGGLTAALELLKQAQVAGMQIMSGCMICSSLGIAPAFHIARHAAFVDLDGPLWLKQDHAGGAVLDQQGLLVAPDGALWGL